jgi:hypothetical protein
VRIKVGLTVNAKFSYLYSVRFRGRCTHSKAPLTQILTFDTILYK